MVHVRLPEALKADIEARAKEANRSLNAEIVLRLEQSLKPEPGDQLEAIEFGLGEVRAALVTFMKAALSEEELGKVAKVLDGQHSAGPNAHFFPFKSEPSPKKRAARKPK